MGQLWNGARRMMMKKMNVLWVQMLDYTIGFVAYTKEALSKNKREKRGVREEDTEKKDGMPEGIPSRLVQNKLLIAFFSH